MRLGKGPAMQMRFISRSFLVACFGVCLCPLQLLAQEDEPVAPKPGTAIKKDLSPEELSRQWHEKTPQSMANRIAVGAALGIGGGKAKSKSFSADRVGVQVFAQYRVAPQLLPKQLDWFAEGKYQTHTGVDSVLDTSLAVQYFAAGGGLTYFFVEPTEQQVVSAGDFYKGLGGAAPQRMRAQFAAHLLLGRITSIDQQDGAFEKDQWSGGIGLEGRYLYTPWEKCDLFTGLGVNLTQYSWLDFKLGVVFGF